MSASPKPRWDVPGSYGYAGAIETMGSVSAPLLAGLNVALAALVIVNASDFHYTNLTLLLLLSATLALISTVQFGFRAKQFETTPSAIEEWWPDHADDERLRQLRAEQRYHSRMYSLWANRARRAYNVGIACSLLGTAALLVPVGGFENATDGRLAVIAVPLLGFVGEIAWTVYTQIEVSREIPDWPKVDD